MGDVVARDDRDVKIFDLRSRLKLPWRRIGDEVGLSYTVCRDRYLRMLREACPPEEVNVRRQEENLMLDSIQGELFGVLQDKTVRLDSEGVPMQDSEGKWIEVPHPVEQRLSAALRLIQLSRRRSQLNGLDEPKQVNVTHDVVRPIEEIEADMMRMLGVAS